MLTKMQPMESVAWEQQEEDQRVWEEDTLHVIAAEEAAWAAEVKAMKKAKQKARELESEVEGLLRKKARAGG